MLAERSSDSAWAVMRLWSSRSLPSKLNVIVLTSDFATAFVAFDAPFSAVAMSSSSSFGMVKLTSLQAPTCSTSA